MLGYICWIEPNIDLFMIISIQCSLGMEFFNPNVAAEMAHILKNYQDKYVPCFGAGEEKTVLSNVPVHGDQLFEERARNVQWTFRDGADKYQKLEALPPEHADWHAKVTLYKVNQQISLFFYM